MRSAGRRAQSEDVIPVSDPDLVMFGERLRALRTEAGLSVRELADRADISPSYLRVLEGGENSKTRKPSRPSAHHVEQLARVLGEGAESLRILAGREVDTEIETAPENAWSRSESSRPRPASNVSAIMTSLRAATRDLTKRSPFMYERAVDRLREFDAEFRLLASGTLECSPEDEPYVTQLAVESCRSHLRAVSYEDQSWWGKPPGEIYREAHERARRAYPDLDITRIFLIGPGEREALQSTLRWHLDLGIQTYVLDVDSVPYRRREDYVLYDETLLRTAIPVSADRKQAEFTDDDNRIREKLMGFDVLRRLALHAGGPLTSDHLAPQGRT